MKNALTTYLIAAAAVLGLASTTYAKETPAKAAEHQKQKQAEVITQLHQVNMAEIEAGSLAAQHGQTQAVRDYGHEVAVDHKALETYVQATATALDVTLKPVKSKEVDKLSKEKATKFDSKFLALMVKDHKNAISKLEKQEKEVSNPQVTDLINRAMPVLQRHLKTAEQLQSEAKAQPHEGMQQQPKSDTQQPPNDMQ